jgi:hypothetical protein
MLMTVEDDAEGADEVAPERDDDVGGYEVA